ncbi:DNA-binding protein [Streptococcus pyogenes]|nr:DNA-binding protein [Streptococcus pyogenes]
MGIEKTVSELADILGVSRQAVNNRVKSLPEEDLDKNEKGVTVVKRSGLLSWKRSIKKQFLTMSLSVKKRNNVSF